MSKHTMFGFASFALLIVALTMPSVAEAAPCPWCVTPSKCGDVNESTPYAGCEDDEGTCEPDEAGVCRVGVMLSPEHRSETLESNGIEYRGVATVDVYGGAMEVFAINDGLFARWNCDGELSQVFRRDEEAGWVALDPEAFDKRYRLAIWIIPEEPHVGAF